MSARRVAATEAEHPSRQPTASSLLMSLCVALFFCLFFLALRSNDYLAVDGAVRCLPVFHGDAQLHGNNHLLYPFWIALWSKFCRWFGIRAAGPFEFVHISQALNSVAAAACIGIFCHLIDSVADRTSALLGTALFGFSTALTLHATNSAEALPGLLFALLALALLGEGCRRAWPALVMIAGFCLALALASYQAMGAAAGLAFLICLFWPGRLPTTKRIALVTPSGLLGIIIVYGAAYASKGIPVAQMPREFFALGGVPGVYGGFQFSRVVNLPFGLARNLFRAVPEEYQGIRDLLRRPDASFWLAVAFLSFSLTTGILFLAGQAWRVLSQSISRWETASVWTSGCLLIFPLVYWSPMYDKLWLLPLAVLSFATCLALRPGLLPPSRRTLLTILITACSVTEISVNLPRMVEAHVRPTPFGNAVNNFADIVRPDDWLLLGWDPVSLLWEYGWGTGSYLELPQSTLPEAAQWTAEAEQSCRQRSGRILVVGLLDLDQPAWDAFIGRQVGIPYSFLDWYRQRATLVKRYQSAGRSVSVWQVSPRP